MENNRILLINPKPGIDWVYQKDNPIVGPPLGLLLVGSSLKSLGYDVKIIDGAVEKNYDALIKEELANRPLFVGLSVMTPQVHSAIFISDFIKNRDKTIPIAWGGIHPTLYPEQTLQDDSVDIIIRGPGEYSVVEIAKFLNNHSHYSLVKGIGFKENGKLYFTEEREFIADMDLLPFLDYDLLDVEKYINRKFAEWSRRQVRTLMVYSGRGCPYRCRFCVNSVLHNSRYIFKSAEKLLNEIECLIKKYQITHIDFRDENFFANKKRILELVGGIKKRNLKFTWEANSRANYFNDSYINDDILKKIEESGCVRIGIGAESGVDRVLEMIEKGIAVEDIVHSAEMSKKVKITFGYSFMMAIPGETKEEMLTTARFILRLKKINKRNYFIGPQIFRPYPGSRLYYECLEYGSTQPNNLRDWKRDYLRIDALFDVYTIKKIHWIKDIAFVKILHFYSKLSSLFLKKDNLLERITRMAISQIATLRIKYGFFQLPLEYYIFSLYYKLYLIQCTDK